MKQTVGIILFNEVEVLDFAGPFEVFSASAEVTPQPCFNVITLSLDGEPVHAVNNLTVAPQYSFDTHPPIDILIIPGGVGTRRLVHDEVFLSKLSLLIENAALSLSICSGARLLAKLGMLDHKRYCTHQEVYDDVTTIAPLSIPQADKRFVRTDSRLFTSGGISAGIDLSFYALEMLLSPTVARKTAAYMEYESAYANHGTQTAVW
ncbi:DJ-1/PfpI family protein [Chryseolinea sp. T2]|uniref:DJ-1/PfpI family protein n=1 Tax=Chryseolinea sp. T2 TaxID=3129255 RepID=UPI003076CABE